MATAVNYIAEKNGGMIAVVDRRVVHFIPLPIGGLMTDKNAEELTSELKKMNSIVHGLGCPIDRPFMFLMFIPLAGIPEYAITDRGLVDTVNQRFISPIIERL
jgi:adenine deaminase